MIVFSLRTTLQPQPTMAGSQRALPAGSLLFSEFWRTGAQIFLILQANSSMIYKEKANLWQWFHTEGKEDFNITGFPNFQTHICPFKMDLRQLSVSMDIWNSSPFPRVNSKSVKGIQWQNFEYWNIIHSALMHLLSPSPWGTTILQLFIFGDGWLGQFFCNSVYNYQQEKLLFTV